MMQKDEVKGLISVKETITEQHEVQVKSMLRKIKECQAPGSMLIQPRAFSPAAPGIPKNYGSRKLPATLPAISSKRPAGTENEIAPGGR